MTRRNDVGPTSTARTGPSQGPGMRTTYSSPARIGPGSPPVLTKVANSLGAATSGFSSRRANSSRGVASASRIRAR